MCIFGNFTCEKPSSHSHCAAALLRTPDRQPSTNLLSVEGNLLFIAATKAAGTGKRPSSQSTNAGTLIEPGKYYNISANFVQSASFSTI
jgi:hypothetical protein